MTILPPDDPAAGVELLVTDLNGEPRGKRVPAREIDHVMAHGVPLIGSLFALDIQGENVDEAGLALAAGDGNERLMPIEPRLLPMPWASIPTACLPMTMVGRDGRPWFADPRAVVAKVVARFAELALTPVVAFELAFYLIDRQRTAKGGPQPPRSPLTGRRDWSAQTYALGEQEAYAACLADIVRACAAQHVATGSILAEYAPGQFEVNLDHVPDALRAADETALLKRTVRGVARTHGMDATFMAKPYVEHAGSGLHLHVSLHDAKGRAKGRKVLMGEGRLRHAVGGLLKSMPEAMAIFAPNVNSYRQLHRGSYAPTTPTWGEDNRTAAVRTLGSGSSRRVEHRLAGADANPYLAAAAILAGLHHGLATGVEPGPALTGNAYEAATPESDRLPLPLSEAVARFELARILPDYLGADDHRLYATCRAAELRKFEAAFDRREMDWYLSVL